MEQPSKDAISGNEIITCLRLHLNKQRPVTLHNTYQGVPVRTEAEVAMVHEDFIGLIVHPYQAVCIKESRYTFMECKALPALIRAYPVSIDFTNRVVLLKQLNIAHSITIDLSHSWIAPEKQIDVDIQLKNGDVSTVKMLGMAVLDENRVRVVMAVSPDVPYLRGDKISLGFQLVPEGDPLSVQGEVHSLTRIRNRHEKRLEVDGRAVMTDEVTILAYIARREDQIMAGLDKAYKKLRKGKKAVRR